MKKQLGKVTSKEHSFNHKTAFSTYPYFYIYKSIAMESEVFIATPVTSHPKQGKKIVLYYSSGLQPSSKLQKYKASKAAFCFRHKVKKMGGGRTENLSLAPPG
jgi:hypothetical protein